MDVYMDLYVYKGRRGRQTGLGLKRLDWNSPLCSYLPFSRKKRNNDAANTLTSLINELCSASLPVISSEVLGLV